MKFEKVIMGFSMGSVYSLYRDAVQVAKEFQCKHVEFPFNGVKIVVSYNSNDEMGSQDLEFVYDHIRNKKPEVHL